MRILAFFKSPTGNIVLFMGFVAIAGVLVYRGNAQGETESAQMTKVEAGESVALHESITRDATQFKPPASLSSTKQPPGAPMETGDAMIGRFQGTRQSQRGDTSPPKPRIPPLSLVVVASTASDDSGLSKEYAPFGRLIPCQTVITLESSKLETPVIGLVTDDVWHNGRLIIPAGAEVHGRASLDRSRERIAASGRWVIVWRDATGMNGTELVLSGIALDREKNDVNGEFGLRDGSAGLVGDLLRTDNLQEIKLFASTFIAGAASGLQDLQTQTTAIGVSQISTGSARNGALQGTADVLNAYAKQIQDAIAQDGFFVRVPAGKQFYLYVTETIDQSKGTRGNRSSDEIWKENHEG